MRPIPVPEKMKRYRPWTSAQVIAAPDGDLTNERIAPAEVLIDPQTEFGIGLRIYATLEDDEIEKLREGGYVEITLFSPVLPVFALEVYKG